MSASPAPLQTRHAAPGRPRGFDADVALAAALELFWRQGYEATSLDDLVRAMGISRSSFYGCFGSKHELLVAAIERYSEERLAALAEFAAGEPDPGRALRAVLTALSNPGGGREGCFLVNCATELAPHDPAVEAVSRRHLERLEGLLAGLVERRAASRGEAPPEAVGARAAALLSLALGATLLRKAGTPGDRIEALLAAAEPLLR
jgi:TetR/AcrR family transcriptional repressor of nem operon